MDESGPCEMTARELDWQKAVLPLNSKIREAVQVLDDVSLKIVLITNPNGVLIGTISDGDVRRGLLKGLDLESPIQTIVHHDPLVVPPNLDRDAVMQFMTANRIQQIPIVNEKMQLIGLHLWDQINDRVQRSNIMVIMAGGRGSRLYPQTENCPKPLLPIAGKPILEHIIERAKLEGFSHFILAICYLGHLIEEYFGRGEALGVKIEYLREESPLGTAGALSMLNPSPKSAFVVTNGDVITDIHYGEILDFHTEHKALATMAVRVHEWQNPFGVVQTQGMEIIGYEEKPISRSNINAGVYVLEPSALEYLAKSAPCNMPTLFELLQKNHQRVIAYPVHERWLDVGQPADLSAARTNSQQRTDN